MISRSDVRVVDDAVRVAELARMLSGSDSVAAREHASELLTSAAAERSQPIAASAGNSSSRPKSAGKRKSPGSSTSRS